MFGASQPMRMYGVLGGTGVGRKSKSLRVSDDSSGDAAAFLELSKFGALVLVHPWLAFALRDKELAWASEKLADLGLATLASFASSSSLRKLAK